MLEPYRSVMGGQLLERFEILFTTLHTDDNGVSEVTPDTYDRKYCLRVRRLIQRDLAAAALYIIIFLVVGLVLNWVKSFLFSRCACEQSRDHQGLAGLRLAED